jgi:hypothetical protein
MRAGSSISRFGIYLGCVLIAAAAVSAALAASSAKAPPLQKTATFKSYTANTYFDPNSNSKDAYFEILNDGRRIYRQQATENGERFVIGTLYDDDSDAKLVTMGRDITGDGHPDLLISEWTGGANCCLVFHIFEIGSKLRKIGEVDAEYGDQGPHFVYLTKGPDLQIQIYDWTFANWNTDFADSPAPKVILEYRAGRYRIAPDLMRTPEVDMNALAATISRIRANCKDMKPGKWPNAQIPPELWGTMLDLIYGGHRLVAWIFLDEAWPKQIAGKEDFVLNFTNQMKTSPYWDVVSQLGT